MKPSQFQMAILAPDLFSLENTTQLKFILTKPRGGGNTLDNALFVLALNFLENDSFFREYFLENYLIFRCLVTTLKMGLRMFSGVWYLQFL